MQRLLASGVPVERSFTMVAEGGYPLNLKRAARQMKEDVSRGLSVDEIFKRAGKLFRTYEVDIISAACESGRLDECFGVLSRSAEHEAALKAKIVRALIYPIFILIVSLFLLPIPTFFTDGLYVYLQTVGQNALLFLGIPVVLTILIKILRSGPAWIPFSYILNVVPLIGSLLRKIAMTRFLRILGAMYASGVPVARATEMAANTMDYPPLSNPVLKGISSISAGGTLTCVLAMVPRFPSETLEMIRVGEESGTVSENLDRSAVFMEDSVQHVLSIISSILGPLVLISVGLSIGYRLYQRMDSFSLTMPDLDI